MLSNQVDICTVFWVPELALSEYKCGHKSLEFKRLWPSRSKIERTLTEEIKGTEDTTEAFWKLCALTMVDGPVSVLQTLLEKKYIGIDYQFDNDPGLLHLACVLQNDDAVQLLAKLGVSSEIKDKSGKTADEVCFSELIGKHLPLKLKKKFKEARKKGQSVIRASLEDKEEIFQLASNPKGLYELQKKLQMFEFQVNEEKKDGDYLVHIAAKAGMCQLPLLMSVVRIQKADINLCNADGMTPLMIFAQDGDCNMCDTLICIMGADPDKQNTVNGKTALHYAVTRGHYEIVTRLIKRGADVNVEDKNQGRPDDIMLPDNRTEACRLIVQTIEEQRRKRFKALSERLKNDVLDPVELRPTDLVVVDAEDNTLIMIAAQNDRSSNLEVLLGVVRDCVAAINVPHNKTGLTALAMAAKAGHDHCCEQLLQKGADASIRDMDGCLPLHHAVINNHENVVSVFKKYFPQAYVGIFKAMKYSKSSPIYEKLTEMYDIRQTEIVQPHLIRSAVRGNADELFNLLEEGDDVNSKSDQARRDPLFLAIENRHLDVLKLLVEKGADLEKRDVTTGNTVLHIVSQTGDSETAKYLMQFCETEKDSTSKLRLDVNAFNNDKNTALQIATKRGDINMINLLIKYGATTAVLNYRGTLFTSVEFEEATALIEDYRRKHTQDVIKLVSSKSKNSVSMLTKIWVPRFDHNLRDENGDTPLMVACRNGRKEMVSFLLQSAVYKDQITDDVNPCLEWETNLNDEDRPKGLSIYHDGIVSHVCAVDLLGNTPFHLTVKGGDFVEIAMMLMEADIVVINMKNDTGLAPVHLACELRRKKILEKLLTVNKLDLTGHPPEEMTKNKTFIKFVEMIQKVRQEQSGGTNASNPENLKPPAMMGSFLSTTSDVSSVDFDSMENVYNAVKIEQGNDRPGDQTVDVSFMMESLPAPLPSNDDDHIDFDTIENKYNAIKRD